MALNSGDPIDLLLGTDGDLALDVNGDLQLSSGTAGVGQSAQVNVMFARGELFYDQTIGVPWFEGAGVEPEDAILGGKFDQRKVPPLIAAELVAAPGVGAIISNSAELDSVTRKLRSKFEVKTAFGDVATGSVEQEL